MKLLFFFLTCALASGGVIYVDISAPPGGDGTSWETALNTIQAGIDAASPGDMLWVAKGVYYENIILKDDVSLYGGFEGGESSLDERDWRKNETIIDGSGAGSTIVGAEGALIDGFIIQGGSADYGGGIYIQAASMVIRNSRIRNNSASDGGGIYANNSSSTIEGNIIENNTAVGLGGGVYLINCPDAIFRRNKVLNNVSTAAASHGGGLTLANASCTVEYNLFYNNNAGLGAGIYILASSPTIKNNTIWANSADSGGGVWSAANSNPTLVNNIIGENTGWGVYFVGTGTLAFNNLYKNTPGNYYGISPGVGDISFNPCFVDKGRGNFHLGFYSRCVDAGTQDLVNPDGETDIGAYKAVRVGESCQYSTIQDAIDALYAEGAEGSVLVEPGVYYENVVMREGIDLVGAGWQFTTIDAGGSGTVVRCADRATLAGFTITGAGSCGVVVYEVSPVIKDNYIAYNLPGGDVGNSGGGLTCYYSTAIIDGNIFEGNGEENHWGGGIQCLFSDATIINNLFINNIAYGGGAIHVYDCAPLIANNTMAYNNASYGAIVVIENAAPLIVNNIFAWNNDYGIFEHPRGEGNDPTLINNVFFENDKGEYFDADTFEKLTTAEEINSLNPPGDNRGNIVGDPGLDENYHLIADSLCIDAGEAITSDLDIDGDHRVVDGDGDGEAAIDIGADERFRASSSHVFDVGWALISVPLDTEGADPAQVFDDLVAAGNIIENNLFKFTPGEGYKVYPAHFTQLAVGEGYWLLVSSPAQEHIIALGKSSAAIKIAEGWNLIGYPLLNERHFKESWVISATRALPLDKAMEEGWIQTNIYYFSPEGYKVLGQDDDYFRPWVGYWILSFLQEAYIVFP